MSEGDEKKPKTGWNNAMNHIGNLKMREYNFCPVCADMHV